MTAHQAVFPIQTMCKAFGVSRAGYYAWLGQEPGEINRRNGGRGVYFEDPDGHFLEILTRPYGSGG